MTSHKSYFAGLQIKPLDKISSRNVSSLFKSITKGIKRGLSDSRRAEGDNELNNCIGEQYTAVMVQNLSRSIEILIKYFFIPLTVIFFYLNLFFIINI